MVYRTRLLLQMSPETLILYGVSFGIVSVVAGGVAKSLDCLVGGWHAL